MKKIGIFFVVVALFSFVYFEGFLSKDEQGSNLADVNVSVGLSSEVNDMTVENQAALISNNHEKQIERQPISEYQASEIKKWQESRGHFDDHQLGDYLAYDVSTLEKLSSAGDMKAMQLLALEKIKQGDFTSAYDLYLDAASLGSTYALAAGSSMRTSQFYLEENAEQKENYLLDAISLLNVAAKRNDIVVNNSYIQTIKDINRVVLSPDQEETVVKMTDELYQKLLSKRVELGLGDFDNSVTPEVGSLMTGIKE